MVRAVRELLNVVGCWFLLAAYFHARPSWLWPGRSWYVVWEVAGLPTRHRRVSSLDEFWAVVFALPGGAEWDVGCLPITRIVAARATGGTADG